MAFTKKQEKEGTMISDWLNEHGNPEIEKKVEREAILKYGEPKQETLEEAAERLSKNAYKKHSVKDDKLSLDEQIQRCGGFIVGFKEGMIEGAKWQQERMYSEEEVEQMINSFEELCYKYQSNKDWFPSKKSEWFEQFKKK